MSAGGYFGRALVVDVTSGTPLTTGKLTGNDAIVVRGRAKQPSVLLIDGDGTRLRPATGLTGRSAEETDRNRRHELGRAPLTRSAAAAHLYLS
jgi:aldehyde:ferredoxin oxidoreductase